MLRNARLALLGIALVAGACGGDGGGGMGTTSALCATPCFAWQYCDTTTHACVGSPCYRRPVPMPGKSAGSIPDPAECSPIASCDFGKGETDALGHSFGRCQVIVCVSDLDCDDGVYCNGAEICGPATAANPHGCVAGPSACAGLTCSERDRTCSCPPEGNVDADRDGHGDRRCGGDDCDDADPNSYPGNTEVCDAAGHDEDCDPATFGATTGAGLADADGDGFVSDACCQRQPEGNIACGTDCDDTRATVNPAAVEACNHIDDDCSGKVDNGVTIAAYVDSDHDGYGAAGTAAHDICPQDLGSDSGYAIYANDCDDKNPAVVPGAMRCEPNPTQATAWPVSICSALGLWTPSVCDKGLTCTTQPNQTGVCW